MMINTKKVKERFMMKRTLVLILAVLLLVTFFAGCAAADKQTSDTTSAESTTAQASETKAEVKEPVTVTWFWSEGGNIQVPEDSYIYQKILKDLNIKYVHIAPVGMAANEKLQTLLAAQEVPDIIESYTDQTTNLRNYGAIIPVEKYLTAEYLGNVFKVENNWEGAMSLMKRPDGHMWAIPCTFGRNIAEVPWIRYDWLKNLGMEVPKNFEELKTVLTAFTNNDPDKNGKKDTVGTMLPINGWASGYALNFAAFDGAWYKDESGNATLGMFLPRIKAYLKFMRSMIESGAIDKEIAGNDGNKLPNGIKAGKVGFAFDYSDTVVNDDIKKVQPEADWRPMPPPKGVYDVGYLPVGGYLRQEYCISSRCKNVEEAVKLMNYMAEDFSTPDKLDFTGAYWEVSYGKKGENWDVTPDGKFDFQGNIFKNIAEKNKVDNYVGRCRRWRTKYDDIARRSGNREDQNRDLAIIDAYPKSSEIPADHPLAGIGSEGLELPADVTKFTESFTSTTWSQFYMKALLGKIDIDKGWQELCDEADKAGYKDIQAAATDVFKKIGRLK
jgi:ABC-type glycerol-3-phosphate transport system substrate-binding protein